MLRLEDCRPGVEVICINANYKMPIKVLNEITTIPQVGDILTIRELAYSQLNFPMLYFEEIQSQHTPLSGIEYGFPLEKFKLLDRGELDVFRKLLTVPLVYSEEKV